MVSLSGHPRARKDPERANPTCEWRQLGFSPQGSEVAAAISHDFSPNPSKHPADVFITQMNFRRMQSIDAALQTIAEQGYTQTSFAEIAKSLGITKGLIAYHFNGKHDLITSAIHTILNRQGAYIRGRVEKESKGSDKLRVYIEAGFEYISQNHSQFVALVDLWGSFTSPEEKHGAVPV